MRGQGLSQLTFMADALKRSSRWTSKPKRRNPKKFASRHARGKSHKTYPPPEWNSCINNHDYGLTREELARRREQRISKNLTTAQVELYDKMKCASVKIQASERKTKSQDVIADALTPSQNTGEISAERKRDLLWLLNRAEEVIEESQQLLRDSLKISPETIEITTE